MLIDFIAFFFTDCVSNNQYTHSDMLTSQMQLQVTEGLIIDSFKISSSNFHEFCDKLMKVIFPRVILHVMKVYRALK